MGILIATKPPITKKQLKSVGLNGSASTIACPSAGEKIFTVNVDTAENGPSLDVFTVPQALASDNMLVPKAAFPPSDMQNQAKLKMKTFRM